MITFETDVESDADLAELTANGKSRDAVIKDALRWLVEWERSERRWEERIQEARVNAVREGRDPDGAEDEIQCMREFQIFAW